MHTLLYITLVLPANALNIIFFSSFYRAEFKRLRIDHVYSKDFRKDHLHTVFIIIMIIVSDGLQQVDIPIQLNVAILVDRLFFSNKIIKTRQDET